MTIEKRQRIRLAGIVALNCAALVFFAAVIMLGLPSAVMKSLQVSH